MTEAGWTMMVLPWRKWGLHPLWIRGAAEDVGLVSSVFKSSFFLRWWSQLTFIRCPNGSIRFSHIHPIFGCCCWSWRLLQHRWHVPSARRPGDAGGDRCYAGWLRNPAPAKGWLSPMNSEMFTTYQLMQDFFHPQYHEPWKWENAGWTSKKGW